MISLWAFASEDDVKMYASALVLPEYLAHLRLTPFRFCEQAPNADGQKPLRLTFHGEGRLEEFFLEPKEHLVPMIRSVCPRIDLARIRLPREDAHWYWDPSEEPVPRMRIYFEPATRSLFRSAACNTYDDAFDGAYVSVSRGHVFIGRSGVESYVNAWLDGLDIDRDGTEFAFDTPSGGVEFDTGRVGGQLFLSDRMIAEELIRFAGMETALARVSEWAELDLDGTSSNGSGVREDGVYIQLAKRGD